MASPLTPGARICKLVDFGFTKMEAARRARYKFLAQYVGRFYAKRKMGDAEDQKASPINQIYNAVTTMIPNLVFNNPQVKIDTEVLPYRDYAGKSELCTNHLIRKIKLKQTLRKVITDSLFLAGFLKTGLCDSGEFLEIEGCPHSIGRPYADRVDPDDMVIDPMARDWEEMSFVGNRFRASKDSLMQSGLYPADKIAKMQSRYDLGAKYKHEASSLSGDPNIYTQVQEVTEYVDLVEVYLPQSKLIVTIPWKDEAGTILRTVEYEGPETGPYHMLGYAYAPDNVLPVAPCGIWYDLHILSNRLVRKINRQAERMKRVLAYEGSAIEDAQEIADADDGETVRVDNINAIKEVEYGGTTDEAYKHMEFLEAHFSKQAGNIDLLGGQGADAPTATQSTMLQQNTNVRVTDMQQLVYDFTGEVSSDLFFFIHTDPLMNQVLCQRVGGIDQQVHYTPEMRAGDFIDYMLKVKPWSMAKQDPNQKLDRVLQFISTNLPAMAQTFQLMGPAFNIEGAMNLVLREMGIEEADELINSQMLRLHIQQLMGMIPPDGQLGMQMGMGGAQGGIAGPVPGQMLPPPLPGGGRPGQPNPSQMGPDQLPGMLDQQSQANAPQPAAGF